MYLIIIILPLLGSITSGFFGRKIGVSGSQIISCGSIIITAIISIVAFFEIGMSNTLVHIKLFR
jgi:NADH-ubiquinone oxidoreductase chain 5